MAIVGGKKNPAAAQLACETGPSAHGFNGQNKIGSRRVTKKLFAAGIGTTRKVDRPHCRRVNAATG